MLEFTRIPASVTGSVLVRTSTAQHRRCPIQDQGFPFPEFLDSTLYPKEYGIFGAQGGRGFGQPPSHSQAPIFLFVSYNKTTCMYIYIYTGWWFGCHSLFSHILGMSSSQLTFIFFRGVALAHQPVYILCGYLQEYV